VWRLWGEGVAGKLQVAGWDPEKQLAGPASRYNQFIKTTGKRAVGVGR